MVLSVNRIAIVDPQPAVRAGLATLLRSEPGLVPVGAAGSAEEALETVARTAPDLVLLEPLLGTGDGLQLIRRITGAKDGPRVVAYTEVGDPALEVALRVAGADGLVDKQAPPEELFEALRTVARGHTSLPLVTPGAAARRRRARGERRPRAARDARRPHAGRRRGRHAAARSAPDGAAHRAAAGAFAPAHGLARSRLISATR